MSELWPLPDFMHAINNCQIFNIKHFNNKHLYFIPRFGARAINWLNVRFETKQLIEASDDMGTGYLVPCHSDVWVWLFCA